jgi:hypothetical protein
MEATFGASNVQILSYGLLGGRMVMESKQNGVRDGSNALLLLMTSYKV